MKFTSLQLAKFNKVTYAMYANTRTRLRKKTGNDAANLPFALGVVRIAAEQALEQKQACPDCSTPLKMSNISLDHRVPISRAHDFAETLKAWGIQAEEAFLVYAAFDWQNCRFTCNRCNKRKGDLTEWEWQQLLSLVTTMPVAASRYIFTKLSARLPFFKKSKGETA